MDLENDPAWHFDVHRRFTSGGHEVVVARIRSKQGDAEWSPVMLLCEGDLFSFHGGVGLCDDKEESRRWDPEHPDRHDSYRCLLKAMVRDTVTEEVRRDNRDAWEVMGLDAAVLDIFTRVNAGEWLGQFTAGYIYVQEVGRLLADGATPSKRSGEGFVWTETDTAVRDVCLRLRAAEKIDLNGNILCEFVPAFRWPDKLHAIVFRFVGDPLGYPNGDAGDIASHESGKRAGQLLGTLRAADVFPDWPSIDSRLVVAMLEPVLALLRFGTLSMARKRLRKRIRRAARERCGVLTPAQRVQCAALAVFAVELLALVRDRASLYLSYADHAKRQGREVSSRDVLVYALADSLRDLAAWRDHYLTH